MGICIASPSPDRARQIAQELSVWLQGKGNAPRPMQWRYVGGGLRTIRSSVAEVPAIHKQAKQQIDGAMTETDAKPDLVGRVSAASPVQHAPKSGCADVWAVWQGT